MNNKTIKFSITKKFSGMRLDIMLSEKILDFTRSNLKKIIELGKVKINDKLTRLPSKKVKFGDFIVADLETNGEIDIKPSKISLDIIFEDPDILIVNKPVGMVVHPGAGNHEKTLVNALIYKYKNQLSNINGTLRPGIVHRIDKETSGLLVVAKNNISHAKLGEQFSKHTIERKYLALIWGVIRPLSGRVETLISRSKKNRQLMSVSEISGKKAITNYKTLKVFNINDVPKISLIECELETGRTHQIRVHMKYKGTSLIGDKQYGKKILSLKR